MWRTSGWPGKASRAAERAVVWQQRVRDADAGDEELALAVEACDGAAAGGEHLQEPPGGAGVVPGAADHRLKLDLSLLPLPCLAVFLVDVAVRTLLLDCGVRIGEALGLRHEDMGIAERAGAVVPVQA